MLSRKNPAIHTHTRAQRKNDKSNWAEYKQLMKLGFLCTILVIFL